MPFLKYGFFAIILFGFSSSLFAHAQLTMTSATPPRYNSDLVKGIPGTDPECGLPGSIAPTGIKSFFAQGSTITVDWEQHIFHSLYYQVDFSPANDANFAPENPLQIPDVSGTKTYSQQFTLSTEPCEACTLRLRQYMLNSDRVYYSCADIVIYDPADTIAPAMIETNSSSTDTSVTLTWTNPDDIDFSEVIILRKVVNNAMSQFDESLTQHTYYKIGDIIGVSGAAVVGSSKQTTFFDVGLSPETTYAYKVFARDTNYNYNAGTMVTTTTLASTSGSGDPGTGGTTTSSSSSSGGALWGGLFLLLAYGLKRSLLQRKSV